MASFFNVIQEVNR